MQTMRILDWYRGLAELAGADRSVMQDLQTSEDCLYLNIWTPSLDHQAGLPIMVYVHGGSNRSGWPYEPNYHGHALAAEGVIVISVAYRLGEFGFFAHPELASGEDIANFGLWDLIAALEWIRDNAAGFGGDSSRITLFGESSGAENIVALMLSSRADDLFDQVILQSTAGFRLPQRASLADERRRGQELASALGAGKPLSIAELRSIPADEFLQLAEQHRNDYYHSPVADDVLIDRSEPRSRPMIIGTNADEWYYTIPENADAQYLRELADRFYAEDAALALATVSSEDDVRKAADRIHTSAAMLCPSQLFAASLAETGSPVWMYRFSRRRVGPIGNTHGAYHGAELPYVFGTHDAWMKTTDADLQVTADTMPKWLTFAKTGNPNNEATANWPRYSSPDFLVLDINVSPAISGRPEATLCDLYKKNMQ